MKILLVNKFLFPKGGAETYVFTLGKMLGEYGHEVQYFGLENSKNTVGNDINSYVTDMDFSKGIRNLTPSIILEVNQWRTKRGKNCKIVYTAHDYQLICPSHGLFDVNNIPCEKCLDGRYIHCFNTKCLKNSRAKSLIGTLDGYFWKLNAAYLYVDTYICCSMFLKSKLDTQYRFRNKTIAIHNFKDIQLIERVEKKPYVLEFGHLSRDKGTDTLLEVAKRMPETKFVFVGYGSSTEKMQNLLNVEYLGFKNGKELDQIIAEASISVCPSEWYENCPFSVIESILLGTPVVGSKIGGIPELIDDGKTGELFEAGNADDLEKAIHHVLYTPEILSTLTKNCRDAKYETSSTYYEKLMRVYGKEKNDVE